MSGRIFGGVVHAVKALKGSAQAAPTDTPPHAPAGTRPAPRDGPGAERGAYAESATIILVIFVAVALGAFSGVWVNRRWASAVTPSSSPSSGDAGAGRVQSIAPRDVEEGGHVDPGVASAPATQAVRTPDSDEASDADEPPDAGARRTSRAGAGVGGSEAKADATQAAPPNAREKRPREKAEEAGRGEETRAGQKALAASAQVGGAGGPCALAVGAGSLTMRAGGGATVTLSVGGANGTARVTASTPDWSDIAVFSESRSGAGSLKYSIRSVGNRPGAYSVSFRTPCGTKIIPVTVTRP